MGNKVCFRPRLNESPRGIVRMSYCNTMYRVVNIHKQLNIYIIIKNWEQQ